MTPAFAPVSHSSAAPRTVCWRERRRVPRSSAWIVSRRQPAAARDVGKVRETRLPSIFDQTCAW
jgi:hypothetical protein